MYGFCTNCPDVPEKAGSSPLGGKLTTRSLATIDWQKVSSLAHPECGGDLDEKGGHCASLRRGHGAPFDTQFSPPATLADPHGSTCQPKGPAVCQGHQHIQPAGWMSAAADQANSRTMEGDVPENATLGIHPAGPPPQKGRRLAGGNPEAAPAICRFPGRFAATGGGLFPLPDAQQPFQHSQRKRPRKRPQEPMVGVYRRPSGIFIIDKND